MVEVVVTQGSVALVHAGSSPLNPSSAAGSSPASVEAGNRAVVSTAPDAPALRIESMTPEEIDARLAWRKTHLQFSAMDLASAVVLMNQHNRLQIGLGDASIGDLRISGVFRSDNPEGFVRILLETFSLRAVRPSDDQVLLLPAL
jgi:transmembrane sensor